MATATDIRDSVKTRWKIPTDGTDTDSDAIILELVNSAYHAIETLETWHWLNRRDSLKTASDVDRYPLQGGTGFILQPNSVREVYCDDQTQRLTQKGRDWPITVDPGRDETGIPTHYWLDGMDEGLGNALQIGFYPIPGAAYTIHYSYRAVLADLTATATVMLPDAFIPAFKDYASWLWALHSEEKSKAKHYETQTDLMLTPLRDTERMPEDRTVVAGGTSPGPYPSIPFTPSGQEHIVGFTR